MKLVVDNLSLERGGRLILSGVSFAVAAGEALVLTGPNGAGKTSLLRAVAGFLPAVAGSVRLDGGEADATTGEQCHYVGHRDGVKGSLSVGENARFWSSYLGGAANGERQSNALARIGLGSLTAAPAAYLSAGQKRRLGLARLLLARRPLWLLDEPTVSLDAAGVTMLAGLLAEHLADGGLVLAATHTPLGIGDARQVQLGGPAAGADAAPGGWAA